MKNFTIAMLLVSALGFAQNSKEERQRALDNKKKGIVEAPASISYANNFKQIEITKNGIVNSEQVVIIDSVSAKDIYKRAKNYIQRNYNTPEAVSKGDIENEFISFNGIEPDCINHMYYSLDYYFSVEMKDGRIRLTLLKASARLKANLSSGMNSINYFNIAQYNIFKSDGTVRSMNKEFVSDFNKSINKVVDDFITSLKSDTKKTDW